MKRTACLLGVGLLALAALGATADDKKGVVVDFDGMKSTTPGDWKEETPSNRLRHMQFRVPKAKDDPADGEMYITRGITGSTKQNLERWKGQFIPPAGKSIDDVTKVTEMKVAGCDVMYVDIQGTYLDGPPMLPANQKMKRPNYRMLAIQFEGPDNPYHIKITGPAKTITEAKEGFDTWLKGFKK